ncbi:hypothetical protein ABZ345_32755 [Lentzea sp. NPDC005914]|uniref:hypothetical protein n=1 Tax=Lentzea sp. NPDC005914 TaxID=3154572 RepID=UPI0033E97A01
MGILFVTLSGHGHVTPTLAVVEELVRRGAEVSYATGAEHAEAVTGAGARWVELPALPDFRPVTANPIDEWFPHYFRAMTAVYPVLLERCETDPPSLICYDSTNWPARLVARKLGIPAVRTLPHTASNEHYTLMTRVSPGSSRTISRSSWPPTTSSWTSRARSRRPSRRAWCSCRASGSRSGRRSTSRSTSSGRY